jgi:hypothetical protein
MSEQHLGILSYIAEACDIKNELGCTVEESFRVQRDRADERERTRLAAQEQAESNVIQFRPRHH